MSQRGEQISWPGIASRWRPLSGAGWIVTASPVATATSGRLFFNGRHFSSVAAGSIISAVVGPIFRRRVTGRICRSQRLCRSHCCHCPRDASWRSGSARPIPAGRATGRASRTGCRTRVQTLCQLFRVCRLFCSLSGGGSNRFCRPLEARPARPHYTVDGRQSRRKHVAAA